MAITKWEPIFPQFFTRSPFFGDEDWYSADEGMTVYETDNDLIVEANVPGIKEDEIDISVEGGVITVKAEHKEKEEEKKKKKVVYRRAIQAKYLYTASVPCPVKADKAEADLKNGILTVTLPKAEEAKPKKIAVKTKAA